jgi:hypothetical protein
LTRRPEPVDVRGVRARHPGTGVVVLSQYAHDAYAMSLFSTDHRR